jgi:predicted transposase/invertase (TIGR01784 family)
MGYRDNAFKRMIGDKQMFLRFVKKFMRGIIPEKMADQLGAGEFPLGNLVLENTTFVPSDLRDKHSDVVWRISLDGYEAYFYILIEHQSSVDFLMPFRLLNYMTQLWLRYVTDAGRDARRKDFKLPPIVPVVFYEGERKWSADLRFSDKVRSFDTFSRYVPEFEYKLVSLREDHTDGFENPVWELSGTPSALDIILYLSTPFRSEGLLEVSEKVRSFLQIIPDSEKELLAKHLSGYLKILLDREGIASPDSGEEIFDEKEAEPMLAYIEKEFKRARIEGRETLLH